MLFIPLKGTVFFNVYHYCESISNCHVFALFETSDLKEVRMLLPPEAATRGLLQEKVFSEISQNSQENTCARVSFLIKL